MKHKTIQGTTETESLKKTIEMSNNVI